MLMARRVTTAAPAIERVEIGTVNSLEANSTDSFWLSLKRSLPSPPCALGSTM